MTQWYVNTWNYDAVGPFATAAEAATWFVTRYAGVGNGNMAISRLTDPAEVGPEARIKPPSERDSGAPEA